MRKAICLALALVFCLTLMAGCSKSEKAAASPKPTATGADTDADKKAAASKMLSITFTNASDYLFNEIYISPTAANEVGDELLGSTSVLKSNGSVDVKIPAYDYDNYDIMVIDEDRDRYYFTRVALKDGSKVAIYFGTNNLLAEVSGANGDVIATVEGTLETPGDADDQEIPSWIDFVLINGTDIVSFEEVYFMPMGVSDESDIGYNHIESIGSLAVSGAANIGVDNHELFDILIIDSDSDRWYFQGISLYEGCEAYVLYDNGAELTVIEADGSTQSYSGGIY